MSDNARDDEIVNEFDQTNGKVDGLEGDERDRDSGLDGDERDRADDGGLVGAGAVLGDAVNDAADTVFGSDEEDGRSREERDEAVTPTSEDERR
jgi:hypothetical protein